MQCPRLNHFRRIAATGQVSVCGHMIDPMQYSNLSDLESSQWLASLKDQFRNDTWPDECRRCQITEETTGNSVRLDSVKRHSVLSKIKNDYLVIGGVLDNLCNSACQTCNSTLSTKIGSLHDRYNYVIHNNYQSFNQLPTDRIVQLDINGGEPTYSKNYQELLRNLPKNLKFLRVNTNGSRVLPNLEQILQSGIQVTITMSLDGTDIIHDYVRWPVKWTKFVDTVNHYVKIQDMYQDQLQIQSWTTVSAINLLDLENIVNFSSDQQLNWSYGLLEKPAALNVQYQNSWTLSAKQKLQQSNHTVIRDIANVVACKDNNQQVIDDFIHHQDRLRGINHRDFYS